MKKSSNDVPQPAKFCDGHIGGILGELLVITPISEQALAALGIDLLLIKP